jgi:hypothetical protein
MENRATPAAAFRIASTDINAASGNRLLPGKHMENQ